MSIKELEQAVTQLSPDDYKAFAAWLAEYDQQQWDKQIEEDFKAGKLDSLVAQAHRDFEAGHYREI